MPPIADAVAAASAALLAPRQPPDSSAAPHPPGWVLAALVGVSVAVAVGRVLLASSRHDALEAQRWRVVELWWSSAAVALYVLGIVALDLLGARELVDAATQVISDVVGVLHGWASDLLTDLPSNDLGFGGSVLLARILLFTTGTLLNGELVIVAADNAGVLDDLVTAAMVLALARLAVAAWRAGRPDQLPAQLLEPTRPRRRLVPRRGEPVTAPQWSGSMVSPRFAVQAAGLGAAAAAQAASSADWRCIVGAALAAAALAQAGRAWTVLQVDAAGGLQLRQPLLRRMVLAVDAATVAAVSRGTFEPDGWSVGAYGVIHRGRVIGYRDRRGGTALQLTLTDGHELLISVPAVLADAAVHALADKAADRNPG